MPLFQMIDIAKKLVRRDAPSTWTTEMVAAPPFDVSAFQQKLNEIAGLTQQGEPVLRLTWGGDAAWFERPYGSTEWVETTRYFFLSKKRQTFGQKIPIRRWIIEQNTDAGQLNAMGGKTGSIQTEETGFYTPYIYVGDHTQCPMDCCATSLCLGDYKIPNEDELKLIKEHTYLLMADKQRPDPRKMVVPEMAAHLLPATLDDKEQEEKDEQENLLYVKDWMQTHGVGRKQNTKPS